VMFASKFLEVRKTSELHQKELESKRLIVQETDSPVRFADIAGMSGAKAELTEVIEFLRAPEVFEAVGSRLPKGILMVGPPGTGKTLFARAVAGEAGVPFFSLSGSDFAQFGSSGAARIKELFALARSKSPSIIFIDEIDSIGRRRVGLDTDGKDESKILNQLLVEMDGVDDNKGVVVLATTNHIKVLDPALIRPGRFDRKIVLDNPNYSDRVQIFKMYLNGIRLAPGVSVQEIAIRLATLSDGLSAAHLSSICNEAALLAVREGRTWVVIGDLENSIDKARDGVVVDDKLSGPEISLVATHQIGHAIVAWRLPNSDPLLRISILPRANGPTGVTLFDEKTNSLQTRDEIRTRICVLLAGRAAEELFGADMSTEATADLGKASQLALRLVPDFSESPTNDAKLVVDEEYLRAKNLLREEAPAIERLRNVLIERKVIGVGEIAAIMGPKSK